jgi:hypothetical protein
LVTPSSTYSSPPDTKASSPCPENAVAFTLGREEVVNLLVALNVDPDALVHGHSTRPLHMLTRKRTDVRLRAAIPVMNHPLWNDLDLRSHRPWCSSAFPNNVLQEPV